MRALIAVSVPAQKGALAPLDGRRPLPCPHPAVDVPLLRADRRGRGPECLGVRASSTARRFPFAGVFWRAVQVSMSGRNADRGGWVAPVATKFRAGSINSVSYEINDLVNLWP